MKKMVRIKAKNVQSKYGYIVEDCGDFALIKVGVSSDNMKCLENRNCIILGADLYEKI